MSLVCLFQGDVVSHHALSCLETNSKQSMHHRLQGGQVMFLGLILIGIGVVAWSMMLLLGQRVHDMTSLHRAADAATYSAALVQARALNMHAYLNRAQVAHQLGMAHLIAVATAMQYRAKLGQQSQIRNPPASLISAFFGPQYALSYATASMGGMENTRSLQVLRNAYLRHERQIHQVLSLVRQLQSSELAEQRKHAVQRMLVKNIGHSGQAKRGDSLQQLGIKVSILMDESEGLIQKRSGQDSTWLDFLNSLVDQSSFLKERNQTKRNAWMINPRCPFKRHELRRRGRLTLGSDGQWRSEETLSFHALRHNKFIGCYHREYPMGWALLTTHNGDGLIGYTNEAQLPDFSRIAFWRWTRVQGGPWNIFYGRHNPLAQRFGQSESLKWSSKGLGEYAEISTSRVSQPVRISIQVSQKLDSGDSISTISSAQTYFESPKNSQANQASLFEPYWHASLIPNPSLR